MERSSLDQWEERREGEHSEIGGVREVGATPRIGRAKREVREESFFLSNKVIGIMGISQFIWHATSVINVSIGQNSDGKNY